MKIELVTKVLILFLVILVVAVSTAILFGSASRSVKTSSPVIMREGSPSADRIRAHFESLPDDFPSELPVYPDAVFQSDGKMDAVSGFVAFSSSSPPQQITKFYEENLTRDGWNIEAKSSDSKNASFMVVKDDKASTVGIRFVNDSETLLTITYGPR